MPKTAVARGLGRGADTGIRVPPSLNGATVSLEVVGPEQAEAWLAHNRNNRHLRPMVVQRYAGTMRAQAWTLSPDAIAIRDDGTLDNGQHRLSAIVESGTPVRLIVLRGLHLADKINIDRGNKRTLSDYLQMERSEPGSVMLASVLNVVWKWRKLGPKYAASAQSARGSAEINELLAFFDQERDAFRQTVAEFQGYHKAPLRPSLACGFFHIVREIDYEAGHRFFSQFHGGTNLEDGDPVLVLRSQLFTVRSKNEKIPASTMLAWTIKAWNAFRKQEKVKVFRLFPNEPYPEPK